MQFAQFIESLQQSNPNGTIILGSAKLMSKLPNSGTSFITTKFSQKSSHPEVPDQQVMFGTNPDFLIVRHQASKLEAGGTNNCITCKFFKPNQLCPRFLEAGKNVMLNSQTVKKLGNGGCAFQELIPVLSDKSGYPNRFFDVILDKIYEGNIAILTGVDVKYMSVEELGISLDHEI